MPTDETTNEESIDQPTETSTPDETQEESQDQPSTEVEEDNAESKGEETPEEEAITIDGESYSPQQAKELLAKGKHFTYEMQRLRDREKTLADGQQPTKPQTDDEKEVAEAQKTLKKYGVVTEDQVDAKLKDFQAKQARASQFSMFRAAHPEINDYAARMIQGAAEAWNKPYEEVYQEGWSGGKAPTKVIKKKIVGASKKATTSVSGRDSGVLTRADISAMSPAEYEKRADEIDKLVREGKLK